MSTNIPPVLEPGAQIVDAHDVGESSDTLPVEHGSSPELEEVDETEGNLESHEVIELQAFIDRKEWIEEKIKVRCVYFPSPCFSWSLCKFLEGLPTIDVFAGMDDLSKPLEEICGLATRAQLNEWIAEHDKIEKETESFDSGDLRKLKKFTKGNIELVYLRYCLLTNSSWSRHAEKSVTRRHGPYRNYSDDTVRFRQIASSTS